MIPFVSRFIRKRYWVYLFPWLMDFSLASFLLFGAVKAAQLCNDSVKVGLLGATWGLAYFLSSLFLVRVASKRNAQAFMLASCISFIGLAVGLGLLNSLWALFVFLPICGVMTSLFFIGFQLFMGESTNLPPYKAAALYTLAWSSGMAFGSLAEGVMVSSGPLTSLLPVVISSFLVMGGLHIVKRWEPSTVEEGLEPNESETIDRKKEPEESTKSIYVWLGWINIFIGTLIASGLRFLIPKATMDYFLFSPAAAGATIFVFMFTLAVAGCALYKVPSWQYRFWPRIFMTALGLIGLLSPIVLHNTIGILLLAFFFGIHCGHIYYDAVFCAINQAEKSGRNVSMNEALVGISAVVGPYFLGFTLRVSFSFFCLIPAILIVVALIAQGLLLKLSRHKQFGILRSEVPK